MLKQRDTLAKIMYKRGRARVPLEEYVSAGNLGLVMGLRDYDEEKGMSLESWCGHVMAWEMKKVVGRERREVEVKEGFGSSVMRNMGFSRRFLEECFGYVEGKWGEMGVEALVMYGFGYTWEEIGERTGLKGVGMRVSRMKEALRRL